MNSFSIVPMAPPRRRMKQRCISYGEILLQVARECQRENMAIGIEHLPPEKLKSTFWRVACEWQP
jgi:hypothetical protein